MSLKTKPLAERDIRRRQWLDAVERLVTDVETWARAEGWDVERTEADKDERSLSHYPAPMLHIGAGPGEGVVLEAIGDDVAGAAGRADLYAWPSLYRVMLLLDSRGRWTV